MPITQLKDEYVITTRLDDQISAGADAATKKLDQLEAAATRTSAAFANANQASAAAAAGFQAMVVPLVSATKAHEGFHISARETNVILREMTLGFGTIGTSILSGIPPMQAFITSIESVGLHIATSRGVIGGLREEFALLAQQFWFWPATAVAAIAGGLVFLGAVAESTARKHETLALQLSGTRSDYDAMATTVTNAAKIAGAAMNETTAEIQAAARSIAAAPAFTGTAQDLAKLVEQAGAVAEVMGTKLPDAAKLYAQAINEPLKAIEQLSKSENTFKLISAATLETAKQLAMAGDAAGATRVLLDGLAEAHKRVTTEATPLQAAMRSLSESLHGTGEDGKSMALAIGTAMDTLAAGTLNAVSKAIEALERLRQKMAEMKAGAPTAMQQEMQRQPGGVDMPSWWPSNWPIFDQSGRQLFGGRVSAAPANMGMLPTQLQSSATTLGLDPALVARLQASEGRVNQYGTWDVSSSGAVGPMQVLQSTFEGMRANPQQYPTIAAMSPQATLQEQGTNVEAGTAYIAHLLDKYKDVNLAVLAYHDGETLIDKYLQGLAAPSPEAQSEAAKVLGGYSGTGWGAGGGRVSGAGGGVPIGGVGGATRVAGGGAGLSPGAIASSSADISAKLAGAAAGIAPDVQAKQVAEYNDQLLKLNALLADEKKAIDATSEPSKEQLDAYNATARSIAVVTEQKRDAVDPTRQLKKADEEHIALLALESPADRDILSLRQKLSDENIKQGKSAELNAQQQALVSLEQAKLQAGLEDTIRVRDRDTANVAAQIAAYAGGRREVNNVTIAQQAQIETMKSVSPAAANYTEELKKNTDSLKANKEVHEQLSLQSTIDQLKDQIEYIQAETAAIGQNTVAAQANLAMLRERQVLRAQGHDMDSRAVQDTIALTGAVSAQKAQFDLNRASANELASDFTNAFDTIGNAITESFVQGTGAAVNWGNVMKSVLAQVIQEFLKLAILNPLLNELFGQNNVSLGSVIGVAGSLGGGGGVGAYGGGGGLLQQGIGGLTSFMQQGIGGLSQTELLGSTAGMSLEDASSFGGLSSASPGILGGASIGSLATGVLGGFGVGSLAGGALQRSLGKTGPGPQIGAGVGAAAGAAIGSIIPGIGTVIGALIGGLIGGGGGGLIGPKPAQPFSLTDVGITSGGLLETGTSFSQKTDSLLAQEQQAVAQVNASLQSLGVGINSYQMGGQWAGIPNVGRGGTIGSFGQNYGGYRETNFQGTDPTAVFSQFRFGAAGNDVLNRDIMDKSFASMDALAAEVNKVNTFVNQTVPNLLAFGKATGSVNDAIKAITDAFDPAIATAKELGYAEADLSNARQAALDKVNADTAAQLLQLNVGTNVATRTAQNARLQQGTPAQIQGAENIALYAFDQATAVQARKQFTDTLTGLYGDTYKTTADYAKEMATLENQLGEQRLSIVDAYTKQIAAAEDQAKTQASGLITNLTQYALNLQTSGVSPLSPQSQLDLSQNQFNAVASTAVMGNPTSLSQISQYSDSLLNAARTVYGSGQGYVDVFNRVVDTLSSISAITPDTLTADIFATETRTQTQVLNDALTALTTQVVALRNQVASNATMPARLAA